MGELKAKQRRIQTNIRRHGDTLHAIIHARLKFCSCEGFAACEIMICIIFKYYEPLLPSFAQP